MNNNLSLGVGGTLVPDRNLYIERPDDQRTLQLLVEGRYCNILTSRQMGKSSLMLRLARQLEAKEVHIVSLDISGELGGLEGEDWYLVFLDILLEQLEIEIDLNSFWESTSEKSNNQRMLLFFRKHLLPLLENPLVVFVDEIDRTLSLSFTDDFFTALRTMYNERSIHLEYQKISFCLIGVATLNELIKESHTTPYNIGNTIELQDFKIEQDQKDLTQLYQLVGQDEAHGKVLVEQIFHWTDGHPYLTIKFCQEVIDQHLQTPEEVNTLIQSSFPNLYSVRNDIHLQQISRFLETRTSNKEEVLALFEKIARGKRVKDESSQAHTYLKMSGIVKRGEDGFLKIRNRIYERVFLGDWIIRAGYTEEKENKKVNLQIQELSQELKGQNQVLAKDYQHLQKRHHFFQKALISSLLFIGGTLVASIYFAHLAFFQNPQEFDKQIASLNYKQEEQITRLNQEKKEQIEIANKLGIIEATDHEEVASSWFQVLIGEKKHPTLNQKLLGNRGQVFQIYQDFWEKRAQQLEQRAFELDHRTELEKKLLLGALASVKRNGTPHPQLKNLYEESDLPFLVATLRNSSKSSGARIQQVRFDIAQKQLFFQSHQGEIWSWNFSQGNAELEEGIAFSDYPSQKQEISIQSILDRLKEAPKKVDFALLSPDQQWLVTLSNSTIIKIWDIQNGQEKSSLTTLQEKITFIQFSLDGEYLVTSTSSLDHQTLRLWNFQNIVQDKTGQLPTSPLELWKAWQIQFGITVNLKEKILPLQKLGLQSVQGWKGN